MNLARATAATAARVVAAVGLAVVTTTVVAASPANAAPPDISLTSVKAHLTQLQSIATRSSR